jgi:hypothetical protein
MTNRRWLLGLTVFVAGLAIGAATPSIRAQQTGSCASEGGWDIRTGRATASDEFFAVRFNRCTGETWVLSAEGSVHDDRWLQLPFEKLGAK